jgi:hypothetical protein
MFVSPAVIASIQNLIVAPKQLRFEVAFGGASNWEVIVPSFLTMSSICYIQKGSPRQCCARGNAIIKWKYA